MRRTIWGGCMERWTIATTARGDIPMGRVVCFPLARPSGLGAQLQLLSCSAARLSHLTPTPAAGSCNACTLPLPLPLLLLTLLHPAMQYETHNPRAQQKTLDHSGGPSANASSVTRPGHGCGHPSEHFAADCNNVLRVLCSQLSPRARAPPDGLAWVLVFWFFGSGRLHLGIRYGGSRTGGVHAVWLKTNTPFRSEITE